MAYFELKMLSELARWKIVGQPKKKKITHLFIFLKNNFLFLQLDFNKDIDGLGDTQKIFAKKY